MVGGGRKDGGRRSRFAALAQTKEPTFYIAGNNGSSLVESALVELGWKRITNKYDDTVKLKWVECKSSVNYATFKQGEQMVNRIPNCSLLTNKLGLLTSLQRYERVANSTATQDYNTKVQPLDFVPQTYCIDEPADRLAFCEQYKSGEIWICKPCGLNQGKGIYLVRDLEEFQKTLEERDDQRQKQSQRPMPRIVQRYIAKPLLLSNRKFDLRAFMLVASTAPYLVCYHKGYARLCLCTYRKDSENLVGHLTNQYIQKQESVYNEYKEETVWSMEKFNQYVNENLSEKKGLEKDWVFGTLTNQMRQIMSYCFHSVKHKLKNRIGYFDLYGFDFMIDEEMKVWLIEINANPCLSTNCQSLQEVLPGIIRESLYLSIECFEKSRRSQPLHPLQCLTNFQIVYDGSVSKQKFQTTPRGYGPTPSQSTTMASPRRSYSPRQYKKASLSHPLTRSSPGILSARNSGTQLEESISGPSKAFTARTTLSSISCASAQATTRVTMSTPAQATPRATSAAPTSKPGSAKVLSLSQATVGLRGALPATPGPVGSANSEVFKFKMTHAALMSSLRMERSKSADKKMLQEIIKVEHARAEQTKAENMPATITTAKSQTGQNDLQLSARNSTSSIVSPPKQGTTPRNTLESTTTTQTKTIHKSHPNSEKGPQADHDQKKQYVLISNQKTLQRELKKESQCQSTELADSQPTQALKRVSEINTGDKSRNKKSTLVPNRESCQYRLTPSPSALGPAVPGQHLRLSDGTNSPQKLINSAPSIPSLKKDRSANGNANMSNTDGGIIVGISVRKNERGS